jgi:hypothetical protein
MNGREYSKARRRAAFGLLACALLRLGGALWPAQVESLYARAAYPWLIALLSGVSAPAPFSLAGVGVALACAVLAVRVVRAARRRWRAAHGPAAPEATRGVRVRAALVRWVGAGALAYLVFLLTWGLNYDRPPVGRLLGLEPVPATAAELQALCRELLDAAAAARAGQPEDAQGALRLADGARGALGRAPEGYARLGTLQPLFAGPLRAPKPLAASTLFSRLGISGIYVPFTGEAHVNLDVPAATLPFAACHELAHLRGFAREDEASFVGYLACRAHPDADFRYSAAFEGLRHSLAALQPFAGDAARRLAAAAAPGVRRDWAALDAWVRRHAGPASTLSHAVNDAYLRSQGQAEGVRSYGRVVDLLLAERRTRHRAH